MLLAEEFVLLALNPDGTMARTGNQPTAAFGVTGALVTELVQEGHVAIDDGRICIRGTRPSHRLLVQALDNLRPHDGEKLKRKLGSIKHAGWSEVVDAMVDDGVLGREKRPLRPTRHPVLDLGAHEKLIADVRRAATGDGPLSPRIATLLALAGPCQMLEVVAPDRADRKVAKRRIKEATEQVPAAVAVKYVIDAMTAAISAANAAAAS